MVGIDSKDTQDRIRLVPARATLHARAGAEVAREARSPAGMISGWSGGKTSTYSRDISPPPLSAAFIAVVVCIDGVRFDPKTTMPPITAAIAPIIVVGLNLIRK